MAIRIALGAMRRVDERTLRFARQLGLEGVVVNTPLDLPGTERWELADLIAMRERVEAHGLRVEAMENTPIGFYRDAILGGPRRDAQIASYCATVAAIGDAGIPVLGFHWMANEVWRTGLETPGRGGARVTSFDLAGVVDPERPTHGRSYDEDEIWENLRRFLAAVLPVAEAHGVRLALHPDDPPVASLGGIPRLFRSHEALRRALELADSPAFGLEFCLGTVSSMGQGATEAMRSFLADGSIVYVHFRDVRGHVPVFQECFLGEGNVDVVEAMQSLVDSGFDGFVIDDHVPLLDDDPAIASDWIKSEYAYLGRAHAIGMLQGLLASARARAGVEVG